MMHFDKYLHHKNTQAKHEAFDMVIKKKCPNASYVCREIFESGVYATGAKFILGAIEAIEAYSEWGLTA